MKLLTNWKTTLAGVLAIGSTIGPLLTALSKGDYGTALSLAGPTIAGVGLVFAKDFNSSGK